MGRQGRVDDGSVLDGGMEMLWWRGMALGDVRPVEQVVVKVRVEVGVGRRWTGVVVVHGVKDVGNRAGGRI